MIEEYKKSIAKMKELGYNEDFIKDMEETLESGRDIPSVERVEQWAKTFPDSIKTEYGCGNFLMWADGDFD